MHPVPAAHELHVANLHIVAHLEEDGVVGRIHNCHVAQRKAATIDEGDRVSPAHSFFALRVEDLVAVHGAGPGDGDVLDIFAGEEAAMPFAPFRLGHEGRRCGLRVVREVRGADEPRPGVEVRRHATAEMDRAGKIASRREPHLPPASIPAGIEGGLNRGGIERLPVAFRAALPDVECVCRGCCNRASNREQKQGGRRLSSGLAISGCRARDNSSPRHQAPAPNRPVRPCREK